MCFAAEGTINFSAQIFILIGMFESLDIINLGILFLSFAHYHEVGFFVVDA
jgi:hypothetical protein